MELTQNPSVLELVRKTAELTTPKEIVWIDGSEAQLKSLRKIAVETGELIKLNEEKLPGCYLNRSDVNDVARVEGRTFICSRTREEAGPTNNWMDPDEMKAKLHEILRGAMAGRTMYVIPYAMGVIGSPFAKYGIEVTDSIYVVLNMAIMTRIGTKVLEALGDSDDVILGVHSKVTLDPENRYIVHFPEENKIISVNSNYGGNVLQGKKCFSLRIASVLGRREGWLAEHMLILGIQNPKGEVRYVTGAFPSACGKTNLAMLIPPEGYRKNGWKCWTVGDDIAWLRVGPDGRLWAVNPENGFFGVAPGTSQKSNPNALASTSKNTIFTNVVLNEDDMTVWWEGMTKQRRQGRLLNLKGEVWDGSDGTRGAHPNSRFTAPAENCPCISEEFFKGTGVPISAIIFGGRRAKTAPLVYQSRDWAHGVFVGATMASETTAAATGAVPRTLRKATRRAAAGTSRRYPDRYAPNRSVVPLRSEACAPVPARRQPWRLCGYRALPPCAGPANRNVPSGQGFRRSAPAIAPPARRPNPRHRRPEAECSAIRHPTAQTVLAQPVFRAPVCP